MSVNIFAGNLPSNFDDGDLKSLFVPYGRVLTARIARDRESGSPRGFGFVEMQHEDEADHAMAELDGSIQYNKRLRVNRAKPRPAPYAAREREATGEGEFR